MTKAAPLPAIPAELATDSFRRAWEDFLHFRMLKKKQVTPKAAELIFDDLKAWGEKKAIAALHQSIKNGWQGVFEPHMASTRTPLQLDQQQRIDKQKTASILREKENREREKQERVALVAKLTPQRLKAAQIYFANKQPNEVAKAAMLKADPVGGGRLTDLIYAALVAKERA